MNWTDIINKNTDPMIIEWLTQILQAESEEVTGAISNEHLWALGSDTDSETEMHLSNIDQLNEYLETIKALKALIEQAGDTTRIDD